MDTYDQCHTLAALLSEKVKNSRLSVPQWRSGYSEDDSISFPPFDIKLQTLSLSAASLITKLTTAFVAPFFF
jgi:hypothetical protein